MSEFLKDVPVEADPYPDCREAIKEWKASCRKAYWGQQIRAAKSPVDVQALLLQRLNVIRENGLPELRIEPHDPYVEIVDEQVRTPAFLRYLAGLMGAF
jgi:hypothetical protein